MQLLLQYGVLLAATLSHVSIGDARAISTLESRSVTDTNQHENSAYSKLNPRVYIPPVRPTIHGSKSAGDIHSFNKEKSVFGDGKLVSAVRNRPDLHRGISDGPDGVVFSKELQVALDNEWMKLRPETTPAELKQMRDMDNAYYDVLYPIMKKMAEAKIKDNPKGPAETVGAFYIQGLSGNSAKLANRESFLQWEGMDFDLAAIEGKLGGAALTRPTFASTPQLETLIVNMRRSNLLAKLTADQGGYALMQIRPAGIKHGFQSVGLSEVAILTGPGSKLKGMYFSDGELAALPLKDQKIVEMWAPTEGKPFDWTFGKTLDEMSAASPYKSKPLPFALGGA